MRLEKWGLMRKMSKRLKTALSVDDELHSRYQAMLRELERKEMAFAKSKDIGLVVLRQGSRQYRLKIVAVDVSPNGTRIIVEK